MNTAITHWGYTPSGESIYLFRLTNASGASIELTNLGASWVSAHMPDKHGIFENILLGYDNAEGYIKDTYYMGATVGRFANRIHQASFSIKDTAVTSVSTVSAPKRWAHCRKLSPRAGPSAPLGKPG